MHSQPTGSLEQQLVAEGFAQQVFAAQQHDSAAAELFPAEQQAAAWE